MILEDELAARHILQRIPLHIFTQGKSSVMKELRRLSANALSTYTPEVLLDYALVACMQKRHASFRRPGEENIFRDEWDPQEIMASNGFRRLQNRYGVWADSVLSFQAEADGDATLLVAYTDARSGGGARREEVIRVTHGAVYLNDLREALQEVLSTPGNCHWGTEFDVKSLSEALDLGVLMFRDRLQHGEDKYLYSIGAERENFPYWISLWWDEPVHFRLAQLRHFGANADPRWATYTSFWRTANLPSTLFDQYRQCNRLAN